MGTLDARLVALHRRTGEVIWNVAVDEHTAGFSVTRRTAGGQGYGPWSALPVGEYGIRGYVDGYDVKTGQRQWRDVYRPRPRASLGPKPGPATRGSTAAGPTWGDRSLRCRAGPGVLGCRQSGAPTGTATGREGDNLYTSSVLALDPETGQIKWHFPVYPPTTSGITTAIPACCWSMCSAAGKTVKALAPAQP